MVKSIYYSYIGIQVWLPTVTSGDSQFPTTPSLGKSNALISVGISINVYIYMYANTYTHD